MIVVIIIRKFPQLTLLDVESLPEVKQSKKKNEVLKKRAKKDHIKSKKEWKSKAEPLLNKFKNVQANFRKYVGKIESAVVKEKEKKSATKIDTVKPEKKDKLRSLLHDAKFACDEGELEMAEKNFIAAIRIDTMNRDAYLGLAEVYCKQGQVNEAAETYNFLLQINEKDDLVLARLGDLSAEKKDFEKAIEYYQRSVLVNHNLSNRFARLAELLQELGEHETALEAVSQAVELEPQNPKYLDMLVEISIMVGDKKLAEEAFQQLRMTNPDNQRLDILKDKIQRI